MKIVINKISTNIWILVIFGLWVWLVDTSEIEGRIFPVAEKMELLEYYPTDARYPERYTTPNSTGDYTAFWIKSKRLRPECGPVRIEWFLGERLRNGRQGAKIEVFWGPPKNRPDNEIFTAGPWVAHIKSDEFKNTYSDVIHTCTNLFYKREVRTPFYN